MALIDRIKMVPVYPDAINILKITCANLSPQAPLCEDKGLISFISQELKDEYIKNYKSRGNRDE